MDRYENKQVALDLLQDQVNHAKAREHLFNQLLPCCIRLTRGYTLGRSIANGGIKMEKYHSSERWATQRQDDAKEENQ